MRNQNSDEFSSGQKFAIVFGCIVALLLLGLVSYRVAFLTFVDSYELAYSYDARTGKVEQIGRTGYVYAPPFLKMIHAIDLRPGQVCMNANSRVLNCKLVRFNVAGFDKFIEWHGRGSGEGEPGIYEILRSYAFNVNEGRDCPFLIILDDMRRKDAVSSGSPAPVATPQ